jgi:hypothetical protein
MTQIHTLPTTHILQTVNIAYATVACAAGTGIDHAHTVSKGKIINKLDSAPYNLQQSIYMIHSEIFQFA